MVNENGIANFDDNEKDKFLETAEKMFDDGYKPCVLTKRAYEMELGKAYNAGKDKGVNVGIILSGICLIVTGVVDSAIELTKKKK